MAKRVSKAAVRHGDAFPRLHITANEAFPAIEALILDAKKSLEISLHVFSPRTKTRLDRSHEAGLTDWGELLVDAAKRGVDLSIVINDFDPIGLPRLHTSAWERAQALIAAFENADCSFEGHIEIVLGVPGGQSGAVLRTLVWPFIRPEAKRIYDDLRKHERIISPRVQALLSGDRIRYWPPASNYTQAFHQKFFIADRSHVILGGLDVDERRFDDANHDVPAPETWQDINVEFVGDDVEVLVNHFDLSLKFARENGHIIFGNDIAKKPFSPAKNPAGEYSGHIKTTAARPVQSLFGFGPKVETKDIETAIIELIERAEKYIYIETQYFRSSVVREALIAAAADNPDLCVFMLLPAAPDVVAFDGQDSPVHRYGEWLQMRALYRVQKAFGDRFGAFCLTNRQDREEQMERDALHGKSVVYVHSKLIMRDDIEFMVGSANLNGRSMKWDFETAYVTEHESAAKALREQLWLNHLGPVARTLAPASQPKEALNNWRKCAEKWKDGEPKDAPCGVLAFPIKKTRRFAKRHYFIPENMV